MGKGKVNVELYEFLKKNETHLYLEDGKYINAYVLVYLWDVEKFTKIIGPNFFSEEGEEVKLFNNYIAINLVDIIDYFGDSLPNYKNCFEESEWEKYEKMILAMEENQ